jgi:hypothetical protein
VTGRRLSWAAVRRCFVSLPSVVEGSSYGTPAFRVGKKFLARVREDGEDLVVRIPFEERETLLAAAPRVFHVTAHYAGYPAVLVRLRAVKAADLARVAELAWRFAASKRAVAKWEAEGR